jgi:hypothetical protein
MGEYNESEIKEAIDGMGIPYSDLKCYAEE